MGEQVNRLELCWVDKNKEFNLEPRILVEDTENSYGDLDTENVLIHGDNLLAIKALENEYRSKIKCICIDPPYNIDVASGIYDDNKPHSEWLQLMRLRLIELRNLLTDDGVIWISIDDVEQAYLRVLCDEIFGRNNFIACLPTIMNLKGNQDQFGFAGTHEYTLVYAKEKPKVKMNPFNVDEEEVFSQWNKDEKGFFKKGANLKATGVNAPRTKRPNLYYPILVDKNNTVSTISDEEYNKIYDNKTKEFDDNFINTLKVKYENSGYSFLLPITKGEYMSWRWSKKTLENNTEEIIITKTGNDISIYKKQRPELGDIPTKKPKSIFYKPEYSSGNGTAQIKKLFGYNAFPYPKPENLIMDFINISTNEGDIVLDSFLGSGTTAAVAHKMNRKWIGIELGEHCYTLCKPRLQKVIDGIDTGGITKEVNWKGGGGFKFYELAPSLLKEDRFGNLVIDQRYNKEMLVMALCKQEGFKYSPDKEVFWKQGYSYEKDYIFVTSNFITPEYLDTLYNDMKNDESLLICCKAYHPSCIDKYENINIKKIPQSLFGKFEYGKDNYNLNVIEANDIEGFNEDMDDNKGELAYE